MVKTNVSTYKGPAMYYLAGMSLNKIYSHVLVQISYLAS
jgi:hypothetical protein